MFHIDISTKSVLYDLTLISKAEGDGCGVTRGMAAVPLATIRNRKSLIAPVVSAGKYMPTVSVLDKQNKMSRNEILFLAFSLLSGLCFHNCL